MSTYYTLKMVLKYCKEYDRNGSWEEVFASIIDGHSTVLDELNILEETLTEWIQCEKEVGINFAETEHYLSLVKDLKEVY